MMGGLRTLIRQHERVAGKTYWQLVDEIAKCAPKDPPIERPQAIDVVIRPMSNIWPDCPLCSASINDCLCDPDAYGDAVYAQMCAGDGK